MRNSRPLQWIEQAEARQVLATAEFERNARPRRCGARRWAREAGARLRRWLLPGAALWRPLLQPQAARVAGPSCRHDRDPGDDEACPWRWRAAARPRP
jgi:hypothetical protein